MHYNDVLVTTANTHCCPTCARYSSQCPTCAGPLKPQQTWSQVPPCPVPQVTRCGTGRLHNVLHSQPVGSQGCVQAVRFQGSSA